MLDMKQDFLNQAYEALLDGRMDEARDLLAHPGHRIPKIVWSPSSEIIQKKPLIDTYAAWSALPPHDGLSIPHWRTFDVVNFWSSIGHCVYVDVIGEGEDFRYRVYGSHIAEAVGFDMTGRLLSEFPFTRRDGAVFAAAYKAVCVRKEPIYTEHAPHLPNENGMWYRLTMPFSDDAGRVARLLTTNVYMMDSALREEAPNPYRHLDRDTLGSLREDPKD